MNANTSAAIDVFLGDHEFQARVNLEIDTDVTTARTGQWAWTE